jgi:hypothetical protein
MKNERNKRKEKMIAKIAELTNKAIRMNENILLNKKEIKTLFKEVQDTKSHKKHLDITNQMKALKDQNESLLKKINTASKSIKELREDLKDLEQLIEKEKI